MAAGPGGATVEQFIVGAQKSTNQLKVVLAKLLPAAGLGARAGAGSAVDALLSDITDSLSQELACLRLGALDTQRSPWQSSTGAGGSAGGGRRSAPTGGQRVRYLPYNIFNLLRSQHHLLANFFSKHRTYVDAPKHTQDY
jgi:hypothetical protein